MLNSILMLGSIYNKNRKVKTVFAISWVLLMLLGSNLTTGLGIKFTIMNFIAFALVFGLGKLFKEKYSNKVVAISSVIIWSVLIDCICYFVYPQFTMGQNLLTYVSSGVVFNYKYVLLNMLVVCSVSFIPALIKIIGTKKMNRLELSAVKK